MMWLTLVGLFAKPLGAIINKGIAAGSAAVIAYSAAKGNPFGDVSSIVATVALAVSTVISGFAASQGVQIPLINADPDNGVKVVASSSTAPKVDGPLTKAL